MKGCVLWQRTADADAFFCFGKMRKTWQRVKEEGMKPAMIDRLLLTDQRIHAMADGLEQIAKLKDPIGGTVSMEVRPNGLQISKEGCLLG